MMTLSSAEDLFSGLQKSAVKNVTQCESYKEGIKMMKEFHIETAEDVPPLEHIDWELIDVGDMGPDCKTEDVNVKALRIAEKWVSNEEFKQLLALERKNVSPPFNAEMVKLMEDKAVKPMMEVFKQYEEEFKDLRNSEIQKKSLGEILSLSELLSGTPGDMRRQWSTDRVNISVEVLKKIKDTLHLFEDNNFLESIRKEIKQEAAKFHSESQVVVQDSLLKITNLEERQTNLLSWQATWKANVKAMQLAIDKDKEASEVLWHQANEEAEKAWTMIRDGLKRLKEAMCKGNKIEQRQLVLQQRQDKLLADDKEFSDQSRSQLNLCKSFLEVATAERMVSAGVESIVPHAYVGLEKDLEERVRDVQAKLKNGASLVNDLYLMTYDSLEMNDKRYRMLGEDSDKKLGAKNLEISAREDINTMSNNFDPELDALQNEKQNMEKVNHGLKVAFAENMDRSVELDAFRLSFNECLGATWGEVRTDSPSGALYEVSSKSGTLSELDIFSIFYTLEKETGRDDWAKRASQRRLMLEMDLAKQAIEDGDGAASKKDKRSEMIEEQRKMYDKTWRDRSGDPDVLDGTTPKVQTEPPSIQ